MDAIETRDDARALRPDLGLALLIGLAAAALYAWTAARSIFTGDSAELAGAAACFGVPHPPGYPLYTFLTACWAHLFPVVHRDFAANLSSGFAAGGAVATLVVLLRLFGVSRAAAAGAAVALAVGRTFWSQAVAAEVYAFDALLLVVAATAVAAAARRASGRAWLAAGVIVGLWLGHRLLNIVYLPWLLAVAWAAAGVARPAWRPPPRPAWRQTERPGPQARHWGALALGALASLAVFLYLPLASRSNPPFDIGDPESMDRFLTVIRGAPYLRHLGGDFSLAAGRIGGWVAGLPREAGIGIVLAAIGLVGSLRQPGPRRVLAMGWIWLIAANLVAIARYNILDIRVYWLPSLIGVAGLAGLGADVVLEWWRARGTKAARRPAPSGGSRGVAPAAVLVVLCVAMLPANWRENDLSRYRAASRHAGDLLAGVPPGAVLFVQGDTQVHSVWYRQSIEGLAPEVLVISLGHTRAWYFDQLRRRNPQAIPPYGDGEPLVPYMQRLLENLGRERRIFFAFDPGDFMRMTAGPWWGERTIVPSGLLLEARPKDPPFDRGGLVSTNAEYWRAVSGRPGETSPWSDFETKANALDYALAALRCADFAQRQGRTAEAAELYRTILAWRPDRWDAERVAAYAGIGRPTPRLELERRAEAGLRARPAAGAN